MTEMSKKQLESMQERFPKGTRIQCLEYKDGAAIPTGEEGTLDYISETGLFHCDLDDGRRFIAAISEGRRSLEAFGCRITGVDCKAEDAVFGPRESAQKQPPAEDRRGKTAASKKKNTKQER